MGAFLDKPVTEKRVEFCEGKGLKCTVADMQGWRVKMEDAHVAEIGLKDHPDLSFFAVFDGHGGDQAAILGAQQVVDAVTATPQFKTGSNAPDQLAEAIRSGLLTLDKHLRTLPNFSNGSDRSGSTVVCTLISPSHIVIGNCGDSRAVLASSAADKGVRFASADHKPTNPGETRRIEHAGGFVNLGRVCGNLAVSRALGDFEFKDSSNLRDVEQKISAEAEMTVLPREDTDEFLLLACDGIWDVMTNEQVVIFIRHHLECGKEPSSIVESLLDHCLDAGSKDNMTVNLVLLPGHVKPAKESPYPTEAAALEALRAKLDELNPAPSPPPTGLGMSYAPAASAESPAAAMLRTSPEPDGYGQDAGRSSPEPSEQKLSSV